jgi:hypothetical protein
VATARRLHRTYDDYLRVLESSDTKLEYRSGEVVPIPSASPAHAELAANVIAALHGALGERCRVYSSDL